MTTVFRYTLSRARGSIVGWGIGLAALAIMMGSLFDMVSGSENIVEVYQEAFPEIAEMFDIGGMDTPTGWLDVEYFSFLPLILGLFVTSAGAGLLARDEERGDLDLILAHPVSRAALFWGRLLATAVVVAILLLISWGALLLPMTWSQDFYIPPGDLLLPFVSLFGILLFFLTLALLFSLVLPARRIASMAAGLLVGASFFITLLSDLVEELERAADFSPLTYLETTVAVEEGLNPAWLSVFIGMSLVLALLSWWRFERRDIRVGGEGTLRLKDLIGRFSESAN